MTTPQLPQFLREVVPNNPILEWGRVCRYHNQIASAPAGLNPLVFSPSLTNLDDLTAAHPDFIPPHYFAGPDNLFGLDVKNPLEIDQAVLESRRDNDPQRQSNTTLMDYVGPLMIEAQEHGNDGVLIKGGKQNHALMVIPLRQDQVFRLPSDEEHQKIKDEAALRRNASRNSAPVSV